jgi:Ca-activated chloride channel family protein
MNILYPEYIPFIVVALLILVAATFFLEKKFFNMVKTYWFFKRSLFSYLSSLLFLIGMSLMALALLDWRGPEEKIKTEVPTERTIILIDTSASMLSEDVKPSRLQKSVLIAKHFARKAAGHQISIVAFAEIQKKIVPFTNDLDLIDSRLESLKNLRNQNGGSALTAAIQESVQYFKESGDERGNILVLTDGEETAESLGLKLTKDVHVALVGIGTEQGGRIPLDDGRGFRFGYKKSKGQDVITRLNEGFFKKVSADLPSSQYWIANSYNLPSDEIIEFFKSELKKGQTQQDMVIRPVMMEWIVLPGLLLIGLALIIKQIRVFTLGLFIVFSLHAQEAEPKLTPELINQLNQLQDGKLNKIEKIKLADDLYRAGSKDEALQLYQENLPTESIIKEIPPEAYLNYGTAQLEKGSLPNALKTYEMLSKSLSNDKRSNELREMMEKNTLSYFRQQEQKKQEKKQQKNNQDQNQGQDQQGQGQQQDNQNSGNGAQDKQRKGSGQDSQKDQKKKNEQDQKDQQEKKDKDNEKNEEQNEKESEANKQDKPRPKQVLPAKLKQLMSDDRQLQMKMIESGTRDLNRRKSRETKDW